MSTSSEEAASPITERLHLQVLEFLVAMYKLAWPPPKKPLLDFFQVEEFELEIAQLKRRMEEGLPSALADPHPDCDFSRFPSSSSRSTLPCESPNLIRNLSCVQCEPLMRLEPLSETEFMIPHFGLLAARSSTAPGFRAVKYAVPISKAEWNRLSELFQLIDRINAGDWSPIVTTDAEEVLSGLPAILNELSPEGWFMESEPDTGEIRFKSVSGNVRSRFSYKIEQVPEHTSIPADVSTKPERRTASPNFSASKRDGQTVMQWSGEISGECKTAALALSEAFTAGLSKTPFVVWWSELSKKFVPGLYCPDIATAWYALAMRSSGTAGGWAICQKCSKDFARRRAKQLYCSARCQTAAGMNRLRQKQKATTAVKPNTAIGRNRHPGEAAI